MRTHTDAVLVKAEYKGFSGIGEATLPPYLPDTVESVSSFLQNLEIGIESDILLPSRIFDDLDNRFPGNMPAKAALDMALWNLKSAMEGKTIAELMGVSASKIVPHTYTIGICSKEEMRIRFAFAREHGFTFFKLKLDGKQDRDILDNFKALTDLPFAVDANQGWTDLESSIAFARELEQQGCVLIEQPFVKSDLALSKALRDTISIPLIADEACQRLTDLEKLKDSFDGINIKLQKCGGITEAMRMITQARELGLQVLLGCMSESSIGCNAAEHIAPLCDWADLDGPWLIENDAEIQKATLF